MSFSLILILKPLRIDNYLWLAYSVKIVFSCVKNIIKNKGAIRQINVRKTTYLCREKVAYGRRIIVEDLLYVNQTEVSQISATVLSAQVAASASFVQFWVTSHTSEGYWRR